MAMRRWEPLRFGSITCEPGYAMTVDNTDGEGQVVGLSKLAATEILAVFDMPDNVAICRATEGAPLVEMTEARRAALQAVLRFATEDSLPFVPPLTYDIEILRTMLREAREAQEAHDERPDA